jgi:hypothetical protein
MSNKLLYRILSGTIPIKIKEQTFLIKGLDSYQKYLAEEYYEELLKEYSQLDHLQTESQLYGWMIKHGYWKEENEGRIKKYKADIEDFKVKIYECAFRSDEKKAIRAALNEAKRLLGGLIESKHRFDYLTPEGSAQIAKNKYLIGLSIHTADGKPVFSPETFFMSSFPFLDHIIIEFNSLMASTEQIRQVARSDNWRKYWCGRESERVFGRASIDLTDEQLNLISWTRVYDNIYQHPDCPNEEVIDDDDALDGFLISDKRKRDKEKGLKASDELVSNERIKNSDEVFIVANTEDDAKKIQNLNDESVRRQIQKREKLIEEKGIVKDEDLPDQRLKKQLAINQKSMELNK